MSANSKIEWTDHTWSPWEGCTKVSPGCDHCYAEHMNGWLRKGANWGPGSPRREYGPEHWRKPLQWNDRAAKAGRRERVFPSVCDPFDNEVDPAWRARFFDLIYATPDLTWLLLTKRIGNVPSMLVGPGMPGRLPSNAWLGATVVSQAEADRDIPKLLATPARVRFLSMEPLLGPVDLTRVVLHSGPIDIAADAPACWHGIKHVNFVTDSLKPGKKSGSRIDWVIVGGESGPGARPMHQNWARSLRDQCHAAGVPFFFKQWGYAIADDGSDRELTSKRSVPLSRFRDQEMARMGKKAAGRLLDGRAWNEVPS